MPSAFRSTAWDSMRSRSWVGGSSRSSVITTEQRPQLARDMMRAVSCERMASEAGQGCAGFAGLEIARTKASLTVLTSFGLGSSGLPTSKSSSQ